MFLICIKQAKISIQKFLWMSRQIIQMHSIIITFFYIWKNTRQYVDNSGACPIQNLAGFAQKKSPCPVKGADDFSKF